MLKSFVVLDSEKKFKGLADVIQVSRCIAKQAFKTSERVFVKNIWRVEKLQCYVVLVEGPSVQKPGVGKRGVHQQK